MEEKNQSVERENKRLRLPSEIRNRLNRMPRPRRHPIINKGMSNGREDKEQQKAVALLRKIMVCSIIIIMVLLLKSINTPFTQGIVAQLRSAISKDFDVNEAIGQLKFVGNFMPDIQSVFGRPDDDKSETEKEQEGEPISFIAPVQGKVTGSFSSNKRKNRGEDYFGIEITGSEDGWIYAAADGVITAVGKAGDYGKYVKIDHGGGIQTKYIGCSDIQQNIGSAVKQGDEIAKILKDELGNSILGFEMIKDGGPIDPMPFIDEDYKTYK